MAALTDQVLLVDVPARVFWPVVGLVLLASVLVLRVISNTLTFNKPPIFEGLPFIGGLVKFAKASTPSHNATLVAPSFQGFVD